MSNRTAIPIAFERTVKIEAGHRCAIPSCGHTKVEIAHIIPWSKVKEHTFENLIALCPNCHEMYDKEKKIDQKSMLIYKANLGLLNCRYGEFERRILGFFCDHPAYNSVRLPGLYDIHVLYLLKDDLLIKTPENSGCIIAGVPSWEIYQLTVKGNQVVENWKQARSLD